MGLEGIVIVNANAQYGALDDPRTGDNAENQLFFKLKQKIVLPGRQVTQVKQIERWKDGEIEKQEYAYQIQDGNGDTIEFIDQQNRKSGTHSRIKFMEFVPGDEEGDGFDQFPCIEGYRHMHFANLDDESVKVPALSTFTLDPGDQEVLGWDNCSNRILNWGKIQDSIKLEASSPSTKLFNPRQFELKSAMLLPHSDQPADQPQRPLKKRSSAGVFHRTPYHVQEDDHHDPVGAADEPRDHASVPPAQCDPEYDPDYVSPSERASFPQPPDDFSEALKKEWFAMLKRDAEREKTKKMKGVFDTLQGINPYLISTQADDAFYFDCDTFRFDWDTFRFDWGELEDLHDKILSFTGLQVVCELDYERRLPDELRPPGMHGDPSPLMTKTYLFERSRARIEEHGPHDKLTVTFSECVDRTWWGFAKEAPAAAC